MNRLEKIAIFLVSMVVTLIGFNLIAAPAVEMLRIGRLAGYQDIADYLAKTGTTGLSAPYSMYLKLPIELLLILVICAIVSFVVVNMGVKSVADFDVFMRELSKEVFETLPDGKPTDHLSFEKHDQKAKAADKPRNSSGPKTAKSKFGEIDLDLRLRQN